MDRCSQGPELTLIVQLGNDNLTLPHRPAAFPSRLFPPTSLPIDGFLVPFSDLPPPITRSTITTPRPTSSIEMDPSSQSPSLPSDSTLNLACLAPTFPPIRFETPDRPYTIALVERGGCDFATKVLAAQERGAGAVIVGDTRARMSESDAEGRERDGLITMFSPGQLIITSMGTVERLADDRIAEDTDNIFIPSVFVSRASYLLLLDMLVNATDSGRSEGKGLWVEISHGSDEGG